MRCSALRSPMTGSTAAGGPDHPCRPRRSALPRIPSPPRAPLILRLATFPVMLGSPSPSGRGNMTIFNLQILRGLAALGVVCYHTDFRLPGDRHTEFFGVSTFFVISGFIMCFITRDAESGDAHAGSFLTKRAIRIVPLYWLCTMALIVLFNHPPITHHFDPLWTWIITNTPPLLRSLFFVPSDQTPMLGVGWTLNLEVYFYVVFAAALTISRTLAPLIAAAVVYAVIKANGFGVENSLIKCYAHSYIHYFLHGITLFSVWTFTKDHLRN